MWTIYTLGDTESFRGVMNGIAMVFGSRLMTDSTTVLGTGSVVFVGMLVTLGLFLAGQVSAAGGGRNKHGVEILLLLPIVYTILAVPKTSLQIEDIYSGSISTIDNVPIGVALPGALVSTLTYNVTKSLETGFSTVEGSYATVTQNGFKTPLSILLALRGGVNRANIASVNTYLKANLLTFIDDCMDASLVAEARHTPNIVTYLVNNYHAGMTTTVSAAAPDGTSVACADGANALQDQWNSFIGADGTPNPGINALLNLNYSQPATPNAANALSGHTVADAMNYYNELILPRLVGGSQQAADFLANAVLGREAIAEFGCAAVISNPDSYATCQSDAVRDFEWTVIDNSERGTGFTQLVRGGASMTLAMGYAFAPLVFMFAIMASWHGLGILVKYLMFLAWTQTWLPMAAIISFLIQLNYQQFIGQVSLADGALTPATIDAFYKETASNLGMLSNWLASIPVLSMALIMGSPFALATVANRISASGQEESATKQGHHVGELHRKPSFDIGAGVNGIPAGITAAGNSQLGARRISISSSAADRHSEAEGMRDSVAKEWMNSWGTGASHENSMQNAAAAFSRAGTSIRDGHSTSLADEQAAKIGETWAKRSGLSDSQSRVVTGLISEALKTGFTLQDAVEMAKGAVEGGILGFEVGGPVGAAGGAIAGAATTALTGGSGKGGGKGGLLGKTGAEASATHADRHDSSITSQKALEQGYQEAREAAQRLSQQATHSRDSTSETGASNTNTNTASSSARASAEHSQRDSKVKSWESRLERARSIETTASGSVETDSNQLGQYIAQNQMARATAESMFANSDDAFKERVKTLEGGLSGLVGNETRRYAAIATALDENGRHSDLGYLAGQAGLPGLAPPGGVPNGPDRFIDSATVNSNIASGSAAAQGPLHNPGAAPKAGAPGAAAPAAAAAPVAAPVGPDGRPAETNSVPAPGSSPAVSAGGHGFVDGAPTPGWAADTKKEIVAANTQGNSNADHSVDLLLGTKQTHDPVADFTKNTKR